MTTTSNELAVGQPRQSQQQQRQQQQNNEQQMFRYHHHNINKVNMYDKRIYK